MAIEHSEVVSAPPLKTSWWQIGIGAILASEIATALSLAFLFLCGGSGAFRLTGTSSGLLIYFGAAPLAGLLVGWLLWWLCIQRTGRTTVRRGVVFGALSGIIAHPIMWALASLSIGIVGQPFIREFSAPFQWVNQGGWLRLTEILYFSLLSLMYVGWITLLVGGIAGGLLIFFQQAHTQR
ncbi:hypothetical protein ccbrp13_28120 [Ktedonobacteria bacterium brp13]|nr:hypothetical protein ccbrp13_28120 [Ktedonobacteria bacterium brp13]